MRTETIMLRDRSGRADGFGDALLADLLDATCAYARLSGMAAPTFLREGGDVNATEAVASCADAAITVLSEHQTHTSSEVRFDLDGGACAKNGIAAEGSLSHETGTTKPGANKAGGKQTPGDETPAEQGQELIPAGVRIAYFIVCSDRHDAQKSEVFACAGTLRNACAAQGCDWGGMLFVGEAADLARHCETARMGSWRRRTSEAMDRLIAAVRMGTSVEACQLQAGASEPIDPASVIDVRQPLPRWIPRQLLHPSRS